LLLGAQLQDGIVAGDIYKELLEAGLIVNAVNATTLRFAPPLTVSDAEIDEAVAMVKEVLK
jgi:acetylornithine/succinyldiaminopimelate/putrescine aminotransferase